MHHIMVDLETLGTVPGCALLSIGAVEFFPDIGQLGQEFYAVINTNSCTDAFLTVDEATLAWWEKQSEEARAVLDLAAVSGGSLRSVLADFNVWLGGVGSPKDLRVYGNGADFDNPLLASAADAVGMKLAIGAWSGRCYRTLKNLKELLGDDYVAPALARGGTHHNALDDAKSQAMHLMDIVRTIRNRTLDDGK